MHTLRNQLDRTGRSAGRHLHDPITPNSPQRVVDALTVWRAQAPYGGRLGLLRALGSGSPAPLCAGCILTPASRRPVCEPSLFFTEPDIAIAEVENSKRRRGLERTGE